MIFSVTNVIAFGLAGLLLLAFVLYAWKDLLMLVVRPSRGMGPGIFRVWAVARTTIVETRAGRAWALPLLWLVVALILILVIRPFDESERIPLYVRMLLTSQEWMLLIMMGVMACLSMPRDRERKIVITNASKPLSRLEMYLGKIVGFGVTAMILLAVMGIMSWVILLISDHNIRVRAAGQYEIAETDYRTAVEARQKASMQGATTQRAPEAPLLAPSESVKRLSQEGSLFAYNYITVPPKTGFSVAGSIDFTTNPPTRFIKGGSQQKIVYQFSGDKKRGAYLYSPPEAVYSSVGERPFFYFQFGIMPYIDPPPANIKINVVARLVKRSLREQERTLTLDAQGTAQWEPERPEELFTTITPAGLMDNGPVEITVSCPTPGVFLQVNDGLNIDDYNVVAVPFRSSKGVIPQDENPRIFGFERYDKQQIAGPDLKEMNRSGGVPTELAVYRFRGADLTGIPLDDKGNFTVAMDFDVDKQGNFERDTEAIVTAYSMDDPQKTRVDIPVRVIEKRVTEVKLSKALLSTDPDPKKRGDLFIYIKCATPQHWIGLSESAVRIEQPQSSFFINFLKSEMVLLCEAVLLIVICVTCSVRLGWPVAMLTSALIFILGLVWPYVGEWSDSSGLAILGFTQPQKEETGYKMADMLVGGAYKFLNLIVSMLPDFTRYDALKYIVELRNMPMMVIVIHVAATIIFTLPFIAAGYMLIRKQELG